MENYRCKWKEASKLETDAMLETSSYVSDSGEFRGEDGLDWSKGCLV